MVYQHDGALRFISDAQYLPHCVGSFAVVVFVQRREICRQGIDDAQFRSALLNGSSHQIARDADTRSRHASAWVEADLFNQWGASNPQKFYP
jgi:hypothetical protein